MLEFGDHCTRLGGHLWYLKGGSESTFNAGDTPLCWEDPLEKEMATTPVFLPGKYHGQRSGVCCNPWGHKESGKISNQTTKASEKSFPHHPLFSLVTAE